MQQINGQYYYPRSSQFEPAQMKIGEETLSVFFGEKRAFVLNHSQVKLRSTIPGVAAEIDFEDGGKFIANDANQRLALYHSTVEGLERNKPLILASIFLVPFFMWFILTVAMPKLAEESVSLIPQSVSNQMGDQSFKIIEELFLSPSELPVEQQNAVKTQWNNALKELSLSSDHFNLFVYNSEYFGPNAFALPSGTVVITDDLIKELDDNPDAILAVLLHEIGHVELKHSLRIVAQTVSNTLAIAVIFGDVEGMGEAILGAGSTLILNSFSRDMESEADDYALEQLVRLGKSPAAFADAMKVFLALKSEHEGGDLLKYLSSHPEIKERIKKAEEFGL
jgi:Zn-dependent protease with chaperone function